MPVSSSAVLSKPFITAAEPLVAELVASGDRGGASPGPTTIVTSSISPGANCALVLLAGGTVNSASTIGLFDDTLSVVSSGSGPSWIRQAYGPGPTSAGFKTSGAVFTAVVGGSSPGSFTVTIDFNASVEAYNYGWALYKVTGHNTSTPFTGAVGTKEQAADHSVVTTTLTAAPTVDDITLALSCANTAAFTANRIPGAIFGQTYGYWAIDTGSEATANVAWSAGQRTGSTSTLVEWSDTFNYGVGGGGYDSGQAAINVKAATPRVAPGPLTAELLHTGELDWDDADVTTIVTPSITPGPNCALVLLATGFNNSGSDTLFGDVLVSGYCLWVTSSTGAPYWTRQAYGTGSGSYVCSGTVLTALISGDDPGSFTVTVNFYGPYIATEAATYAWALYKVTGHNNAFPFAGAVATMNQAGQGSVIPVLTTAPASGDITLAISEANAFNSTGATPGATFGSTYGTWTVDDTSDGTQKNAWVVGQRTGSTSTNVEFSDVNAHNSDNYSSAQAAIIVKAPIPTGGTITESGGYRIHTFTSNGTFNPQGTSVLCDTLCIGGGGAGGGVLNSGSPTAGGGGGEVVSQSLTISTAQTITVGNGGVGVTAANGGNGGISSIGLLATAIGGGGGGRGATASSTIGSNGASGGGGGGGGLGITATGGVGSPGGNGGDGRLSGGTSQKAGGGGGGAGGNGLASIGGSPSPGGVGGPGVTSSISGTSTSYAAGGGGGSSGGGAGAAGGSSATAGVGGAGDPVNAPANRGGGGGGRGSPIGTGIGANGGSGVVIIRYPI